MNMIKNRDSETSSITVVDWDSFIQKLIEDNLEYYMEVFGYNSWFDRYKVRVLLFKEVKDILIKLKAVVNAIFWVDIISGSYNTLVELPIYKLWWSNYWFTENLEEHLARKIRDAKRDEILWLLKSISPFSSFSLDVVTAEELAKWKDEVTICWIYWITKKWLEVLDQYLRASWSSLSRVTERTNAVRSSVMWIQNLSNTQAEAV